MTIETPPMGWNWEHPAEAVARMDEFLVDMARCQRLEALPGTAPFTRSRLAELGVTGIEFAAWKTAHRTGLGTDLVPLRTSQADTETSDSTEAPNTTEPGRLFRVDGTHYFTQLDICQPLPLESGCLDWAYAEHLVEHVSLAEGIGWLAEVRRILAPGGLIRLTTPDLGRYVRGYLQDDGLFAKHRGRLRAAGVGAPMPARNAFMFNQMFYLWGHRWIYDEDELRHALTEAGFDPAGIEVRAFRKGARPDVAALDQVLRNDETIYIEATA